MTIETREDRARRELASAVRAQTVEELHTAFVREGVTRAFVVFENGTFTLSHPKLLEPIQAFFELSADFARHEAVFIGREDGLPTLFFAFVHDTRRGLAQGGLRFKAYPNLAELLVDGLRLAQGMTRKNALAGLWWGGGKGIMALPQGVDLSRGKPERRAYFEAYGRFVASLGGVYYTAEDINTYTEDMDVLLSKNRFTTCISRGAGGSGNPSPYTARGVFRGMQAGWQFLTGKESLRGVRVAVQGVGNVGGPLVDLLVPAGAALTVTDVSRPALEALKQRYPEVAVVEPDAIFDVDADVFAPCAIGAQVNALTIPRLRVKLVCGAANNILKEPEADAERLRRRGIAFVPDYVCNRMGITNCADEWRGYLESDVAVAAERVFPDTLRVLKHARNLATTSLHAANDLADIAASELHPLLGHRGRRIIDHLIASGWHEAGGPKARERKGERRVPQIFTPALDEPPVRLRWERENRFRGDGPALAAAPISAASTPTLGSFLSPLLMDVAARADELATGRRPRRILGSEHGGLALQLAVERSLPYEREDVGRTEFFELCRDAYNENDASIRAQLRDLGVGYDPAAWLDPMGDAGRKATLQLYYALLDAGLVRREDRMVQRCPRCATVLVASDVAKARLSAEARYAMTFEAGGLRIETTTYFPELLLGAAALAVRKDGPYAAAAESSAAVPGFDRAVPVVAVERLEANAVFLVPAHVFADERLASDARVAARPRVFDRDGRVLGLGPEPLDVDEARKRLLARLGAAVRAERGTWPVDVERCRRCETIAFSDRSAELFVDVTRARRQLRAALENGTVDVAPEWGAKLGARLSELDLWCVSRQEWWGHEIPAGRAGGDGERLDVFSTWFSAVALTLAGLGWPAEAAPAPVEEVFVDADVLQRWAMPTLLAGYALFGRPAFRRIHVQGPVLVAERRLEERPGADALAPDEERRRARTGRTPMRKNRGNVVEPSSLVARFGADALRLGYLLCLRGSQQDGVTAAEAPLREARRAVRRLVSKVTGLFSLVPLGGAEGEESAADREFVELARRERRLAEASLRERRFDEAAASFLRSVEAFADFTRGVAKDVQAGRRCGSASRASARVLREFATAYGPICPFTFEFLSRWVGERSGENHV